MESAVRACSLASAVGSRPGSRRLGIFTDRVSCRRTIWLSSTQDTKTRAQIAGVAGFGWGQVGVDWRQRALEAIGLDLVLSIGWQRGAHDSFTDEFRLTQSGRQPLLPSSRTEGL
jgi:hypothetical protein